MGKSNVIPATIIAIAIVLSVCIYVIGNRYSMVSGGERTAYKVDKFTGATWWVVKGDARLVKEKRR